MALARLRGITVLSLEQAVAAPLCTMKLADQGARVIKIERDGQGDFARGYDNFALGSSSYFAWLNRGKESLEVDIKKEEHKEALLDMISSGKVDVFVQNLAPGAAARAGFGASRLRELNDRLITLDISGYGEAGPRASYKAYDLLVAAEAGLCDVTGTPEEPARVGVSISDITCGMNGYAAVLEGLFERERTGKGGSFKVSLFDTIAEIMNVPYIQQKYTGSAPQRMGLRHPSIAPYGAFKTLDHRTILISVQNDREWVNLCELVLEEAALVQDERFSTGRNRVANREEVDAFVAKRFSEFDAETLASRLLEAGIAFGELNSVEGLVKHPQLRTVTFETDKGEELQVPAPAVLPSEQRLNRVPALGEHNKIIEKDFGVSLS